MNIEPAAFADRLIGHVDRALRAVCGTPTGHERISPARDIPEPELSAADRDRAARLMRVNHAGEVAAQALYHGQSLTAREPDTAQAMQHSAEEELDHLAWCGQRLTELDASVSLLNPIWYAGSFSIGALAGLMGDRFSLGFITETENQVVAHLDRHLERLPAADERSRAVLQTMRSDEMRHGSAAEEAGGQAMPEAVSAAMAAVSKIMTRGAYWV